MTGSNCRPSRCKREEAAGNGGNASTGCGMEREQMANEAGTADQTRTTWESPLRATVAMALGRERIGPRLADLVARRGWVYFIRAACGSIKIGQARNVEYRLRDLQCANPQELTVLAVVPDGRLETDYHRRFAEHRGRGEWFEPHPDILDEIEKLNTFKDKDL